VQLCAEYCCVRNTLLSDTAKTKLQRLCLPTRFVKSQDELTRNPVQAVFPRGSVKEVACNCNVVATGLAISLQTAIHIVYIVIADLSAIV
jgi:hypothetical protein